MKRLTLALYALLPAWYLFLAITTPTDQATMLRRHLSHSQALAVSLSIAVPVIVIWLIAFYGAERLHAYSRSIKDEVDGPHFMKLAFGLQILALYLPIRMVLKASLTRVTEHHASMATFTNIVIVYVNLILPLVAFVIIGQAARGLGKLAKIKTSLRAVYVLAFGFICLGTVYCYGIFAVKGVLPPNNWLVTSQQSIPEVLRILTVVIPYLLMWLIGLIAAYEIYLYQRQVQGIFYRQSLRLLAYGLLMVILVSIAIQSIGLIAPSLLHLSLKAVLAITYSLLLLLGAAFATIARGVAQLRQL